MLEHWLSGLGDRLCLAALLALAASGCGGSDSESADYEFGAAEVEQLVIGSWTGTWTELSGSSARLALDVSRQPTRRTACDSRALGEGNQLGPQSSVRCVSSSEMLLAGNLSVQGMFADLPLTGGVWVPGFELNAARLSLSGNDRRLSAEWHAGSWQECRVQRPTGESLAECTLERAP
jgi:hypothetical protein